ncbi:MAG: SirB2 family protein [Steroidobacteraceae bacterium]|nr:SirB2 family protein [Steroidobacteraceae bacterium]
MTAYYFALRQVHIACAMLTITLFTFRGLLMLSGSQLHRNMSLRVVPVAVDTVLLTTALMLTTVIRQYPFATGWLTTKVVLLVAYVALGSIALRPGRTRGVRMAAFIAALATVAFIVTVARTHSPLGAFS